MSIPNTERFWNRALLPVSVNRRNRCFLKRAKEPAIADSGALLDGHQIIVKMP
jgi:hypothetical protein